MTNKSLKFFMREQIEEIVTAPAPKGFTDGEGNPLELEIKVLSNARIQEIFASYRKRSVAVDDKGRPFLTPTGEVCFQTERDSARAVRHTIAEALVYPDLKDPELMKFYNCVDITDMPLKVFTSTDEYAHVNKMVMNALGLGDQQTDSTLIEAAKN